MKILYLVEDETSTQFRYRVKNVIEALQKSKKHEAEFIKKSEYSCEKLEGIGCLVILRQTDKDGELGKIVEEAHSKKIVVLYDIDDLVFSYRDLPLLMWSTNSKNIFYWSGYFWGIRRIAKKVDGFLCTNEFLAGKLKRSFGKTVKVIPNSLNKKQLDESEKWVKKLDKLGKAKAVIGDKRKFVVGYFSGSPTHVKDFRLIEGELIQFLKTKDDVVLRVVGDMKLSREMQKWVEAGRVELSGKVDYLRLQGLMARVDVNIAPLLDNDFTNCKSELKFFEAAAVETTTIASPTYTFKKAITNGKNGFLARPGEWYERLEYLYDNPKDNRRMALAAKGYAIDNYYGKEFLRRVEEGYDHFAK